MLKSNIKFFIFIFSLLVSCSLSFAEDNIQILKEFVYGEKEYRFRILPENAPLIPKFPLDALKNDPGIKSIEYKTHIQGDYYLATLDVDDEIDAKVRIYFNIHTSVENARIEMMEQVSKAWNATLDWNALDYKVEKSIGDNCFYGIISPDNDLENINPSEMGYINFLRNNVKVSIQNEQGYYNHLALIGMAEKVDQALLNCEKVNPAGLINAPKINSFNITGNLPTIGSGEDIITHIDVVDPQGSELIYRRYGLPESLAEREGIPKFSCPKKPGTYKLVAWVINKDRLVSMAYKEVTFTDPTKVEDEGNTAEVPKVFELYQNRPNPFNPATVISYDLSKQSDVVLTIHDTLGRKVRILANSSMNPGKHEILWDGRDGTGNNVSSGIYYCRIQAAGHTGAIGMTLVR